VIATTQAGAIRACPGDGLEEGVSLGGLKEAMIDGERRRAPRIEVVKWIVVMIRGLMLEYSYLKI